MKYLLHKIIKVLKKIIINNNNKFKQNMKVSNNNNNYKLKRKASLYNKKMNFIKKTY